MEGQIELLDYLKSLEKDGFDILDYIPTGHANAVTREYLCSVTGTDDRNDGMPYRRRGENADLEYAGWKRIFYTGHESGRI